ncbi:MAG: hypothetical protein A3B47_00010 [Candidatus Levybacteria bacterium RIFCSPLOWO2_01_FULL_39_24]|nr:MAG: hypothetical protein A2800_01180 [Candidatus Levybacteria bacterium RIFCSPHIGHO2_01_FULL_40_16]OGH28711.1 MAG: hypothetical protein A3E12_03385 [Candidatus Levybacteria bacterium RIFCSPHIGHO2_12_FULL_39_9]OGH46160.1 MAG: hypothetical protein A3B47_00010 [Candidatus Levybacteria bacterium RIFCSPLOWO2_01_FULL_39_24]
MAKSGIKRSPYLLSAILGWAIGVFLLVFIINNQTNSNVKGVSTGFDQYGYNRTARNFVGPADGVDRVLDGKVWGDSTYAKDRLVMKWNAEWDKGNAEGWKKPPYNAWTDNEWNGMVPNGSGETWHYKIVWVGPCGAAGIPVSSGGYCIWGQFAVILSQGTFAGQHFWDVLARPAGYGSYYSIP